MSDRGHILRVPRMDRLRPGPEPVRRRTRNCFAHHFVSGRMNQSDSTAPSERRPTPLFFLGGIFFLFARFDVIPLTIQPKDDAFNWFLLPWFYTNPTKTIIPDKKTQQNKTNKQKQNKISSRSKLGSDRSINMRLRGMIPARIFLSSLAFNSIAIYHFSRRFSRKWYAANCLVDVWRFRQRPEQETLQWSLRKRPSQPQRLPHRRNILRLARVDRLRPSAEPVRRWARDCFSHHLVSHSPIKQENQTKKTNKNKFKWNLAKSSLRNRHYIFPAAITIFLLSQIYLFPPSFPFPSTMCFFFSDRFG